AYVEGTAETLGPHARVQVARLVDEREAAALEEADLVRPGEQHRDADASGLDLGGGDQRPSDPRCPHLRSDGQPTDLGDVAPQDVERAVAGEARTVRRDDLGHEEVPEVLEDALHWAHQHAALTRPVPDVLEDVRHVVRACRSYRDRASRWNLDGPGGDAVETHLPHSSSAACAAATASKTRPRAGPPTLSRASTTVSRSRAAKTDPSIRASTSCICASVSSSRVT